MAHMETRTLQFSVRRPFGNLLREKCVLVAARDDEGKVLVGAKSYFYPPTISRLLGGGVDEGESLEQAAVRELEEELGVRVPADALLPLVLFDTTATDEHGKVYRNQTAVFEVHIGSQAYQAGDDVSTIVKLTPNELRELGERYEQLPGVLWYNGKEGLYAWADYAKLYGPIHKIIAGKLRS